jgi:DNA polymerase-3 subunit beta
MKVQTTAGQLRAGLRLFKGIISRRNTIPVLGTVLLRDGKLTGTDLDCEISVALPSIGPMEGAAAIDWFALSALANAIDRDDELSLDESDGVARVAFNGSDYRMPSIPPGDFPAFNPVEGVASSTGNLGLVAALRRVRFAICQNETRYYLNGVALLKDADGQAIVVATDGHRVAVMPIDFMPEGAEGGIIPQHVVAWLCVQGLEPDSVVFNGAAARARFEFAGATLATKLIDGKFPDILKVVPAERRPVFEADRLSLLRLFRRMRAFQRHWRYPAAKMSGGAGGLAFTMKDNGFEMRESFDVGEVEPFEVGFSLIYLIDAMTALRGERVTFHAGPSGEPWTITSDGDKLWILLMPRRA